MRRIPPVLLLYRGKLLADAIRRERLTETEVLAAVRQEGQTRRSRSQEGCRGSRPQASDPRPQVRPSGPGFSRARGLEPGVFATLRKISRRRDYPISSLFAIEAAVLESSGRISIVRGGARPDGDDALNGLRPRR